MSSELFKEVFDKLEKIKDEEKQLAERHHKVELFSGRLLKVISQSEILFNLSGEQRICELTVHFLRNLHPNATVRFLSAKDNCSKLSLSAECGSFGKTSDKCQVYPFNCLALKRCRSLICTSLEDDIFCSELLDLAEDHGYMCVPLMANGSVLGCINMLFKRTEGQKGSLLDENDLKVIEMFTDCLSLILNNNQVLKTIKKESLTDRLTGLPNRRHVLDALQNEISRSERFSHVFTLAMLDIDNFKEVNDNYGHDEGDRVLILLADTAYKSFRKIDIIARYGGEEFLAILPETDLQAGILAIERFRKEFNQQTFSDSLEAKNITLSGGLVEYPTDSKESALLIKLADERMFKAKKEGRNRVIWK